MGLPLDDVPGASFAVGLRKLRTAYAGSCIRVRRTSDSTEQDIGFSGNDLDTTSLLSFVGASNGRIVKWYDQGTNAYEGRQTTAGSQPTIATAGVLEVNSFSKPRIKFASGIMLGVTNSSGTTIAISSLISNSADTKFALANITTFSTAANPYDGDPIFADAADGAANSYWGLYNYKPGSVQTLNAYIYVSSEKNANLTASTATDYIIESRHESGNLYNKATGITETSLACLNVGSLTSHAQIGPITGYIYELFCYNTAISSGDRSTLNSNINAYYLTAGATFIAKKPVIKAQAVNRASTY